jgi:outer membrane autotransporter protein
MLTYKEPGYDASPKALRLIVGKNANSYFGYEGMVAVGAGSSSSVVNGVSVDLKVPTMYGFYAKAFTKLDDNLELFGRLGWAHVSRDGAASSSTINRTIKDSGSGISYGGGIKYKVSKNVNVFADYMSYYPEKNNVSIEGFTFGAGFSF